MIVLKKKKMLLKLNPSNYRYERVDSLDKSYVIIKTMKNIFSKLFLVLNKVICYQFFHIVGPVLIDVNEHTGFQSF